jgi:hypothetical protein
MKALHLPTSTTLTSYISRSGTGTINDIIGKSDTGTINNIIAAYDIIGKSDSIDQTIQYGALCLGC